jgi:hypothetical protein
MMPEEVLGEISRVSHESINEQYLIIISLC